MKTRSPSILASAVAASLVLAAAPALAADYPGTDTTKASSSTTTGQKKASDTRSQKAADQAWQQAHRASKIIGTDVQNGKGEKVGKVKDLVLDDPASGQITRVVVSVGGVSGLGDKLFAIPYRAFRRDDARHVLVLDSNSDLAHAFDDNDWQAAAGVGGTNAASASSSTPAASAPGNTAPGTTPSTASVTPSTSTASAGSSASSPGTTATGSASDTASAASGGASDDATASPAHASDDAGAANGKAIDNGGATSGSAGVDTSNAGGNATGNGSEASNASSTAATPSEAPK
jgi:sporulation protein YlmC with PRC-barrel domain